MPKEKNTDNKQFESNNDRLNNMTTEEIEKGFFEIKKEHQNLTDLESIEKLMDQEMFNDSEE